MCEAFQIFDLDGGGSVGVEEVAKIIQALGQDVDLEEVQRTVDLADDSGDGELDQVPVLGCGLTGGASAVD